MKRLKIKSLKSGLVLGEILELVRVDGELEYVVQNKNGRFFMKHSQSIILVQ